MSDLAASSAAAAAAESYDFQGQPPAQPNPYAAYGGAGYAPAAHPYSAPGGTQATGSPAPTPAWGQGVPPYGGVPVYGQQPAYGHTPAAPYQPYAPAATGPSAAAPPADGYAFARTRSGGYTAVDGVSQLQDMFPHLPRSTLEAVLAKHNGNVQTALNECLGLQS